jgi:hypothetical protein
MKVALCISGLTRLIDYSYPYLKKFIIDPLQPDIFYHGYSDDKKGFTKEHIVDLYKPKDHLIREWTTDIQEEIWEAYGTRELGTTELATKPINILSMHYNIYKCNELKKQYENDHNFIYDIVIRGRSDIYHCRPITDEELLTAQLPMTVVTATAWDFRGITGYGVSDHFGFGSSHAMDLYSNLFNRLAEYNLEHKFLFHPESVMGYNLHNENVNRVGVHVPHYFLSLPDFVDNPFQDFSNSYIEGFIGNPKKERI